MLTSSLKSEISWFAGGLLAAFLVGLILGWPLTSSAIFLCGYSVWLLTRMASIVKWLRNGAKVNNVPQTAGLTDEIVELIHREKKYSRKQRNRYRSTLAQFNSLAADLPDATIVLNEDYEIRWANSAAVTLLNISQERDRGQRIDNLIRNPDFREYLYDSGADDELEIRGPVSQDRILSVRKVPTGQKMMVLIAADITQRVQVREMRKAFVGDVSHELRTPLTVIRGYLEMLMEDDELDADVIQALELVSVQSDRMRGIVDDLLELSKLEGNPLADDEGDPVNIGSMIRSMIGPLQEVATKHHFKLNIDDSLALLGSEGELYSACNNLLTNAVKYTDPGSTITVSWYQTANGSAAYSVSDDGPGIEARHLPRLSERFYRVDKGRSRESGGTGLGLAIVKHAVQRHGGTLEIDSTPGTGSEFQVTFPPNRSISLQKAANL